VSLAQMLFQDGFRDTSRTVRRMFSDLYVLYWSFWWTFGFVSTQIFVNYNATQVYNLDANASFGFYNAGLEAVWMLSALLPSIFKVTLLRDNTALVIILLSLIEGICLLSTVGCRSLALLVILHCVILIIAGALQVTATAVIAIQIEEPRYAAITSLVTFGALSITTIALEVGSVQHWATSTYFYFITVLESFIVAAFTLIFLGNSLHLFYHRHCKEGTINVHIELENKDKYNTFQLLAESDTN
jgi:hypothetical protein